MILKLPTVLSALGSPCEDASEFADEVLFFDLLPSINRSSWTAAAATREPGYGREGHTHNCLGDFKTVWAVPRVREFISSSRPSDGFSAFGIGAGKDVVEWSLMDNFLW
jgi:hypothetical protein